MNGDHEASRAGEVLQAHGRIAYDAESFLSGKILPASAQAVLERRKAICDDYAELFLDLCEQAGVKAVKITGTTKGTGPAATNPDAQKHAWNAVYFDQKWWLVDTTWGAGGLKGGEFQKRFSDFYFLCPPDKMIFSHFPSDASRQQLPKPLSEEQFRALPDVPQTLFELGVSSAAIREAAASKAFRGLVESFAHPGKATAVRVPVQRHLKAGQMVTFELRSDDYEVLVLVDEEKRSLPFRRIGTVFRVSLRPGKGKLMIAGRLKGKPQSAEFSGILQYIIE